MKNFHQPVFVVLVAIISGEALAQEDDASLGDASLGDASLGDASIDDASEAAENLLEEQPVDPNVERAFTHFQVGMELAERAIVESESEFWESALAEFDESIRLHRTAAALLNRALCLRRLLRYHEALMTLDEYLTSYGTEITPATRSQVQRSIEDIRVLVTEVRLEVTPPGSTIVVQGRTFGESPLAGPLLLQSGQHRIEVRLEGYQSYQEDIIVVRGRPVRLRIDLSLIPDTGLLRITTIPESAHLSIDGEDVGNAPYEGRFRPGVHIVEVAANLYRSESETVTIDEGGLREVQVELHRNRLPRGPFWGLLGTSIVGIVTTAIFGAITLVCDASYDPLDSETYHYYENGHSLIIAADVSLGITLAASLSTLVLGFFTDWSHSPAND